MNDKLIKFISTFCTENAKLLAENENNLGKSKLTVN